MGSTYAVIAQVNQEDTSARIKRTQRYAFGQRGYLHRVPWATQFQPLH